MADFDNTFSGDVLALATYRACSLLNGMVPEESRLLPDSSPPCAAGTRWTACFDTIFAIFN
jgi:hypothetical protein